MSTLSKTVLPIPESVVVGSGSYTVPANKYGFFSASASATASVTNTSSPYINHCSAMGLATTQWLTAGTTVSATSSAPSLTTNSNIAAHATAATVFINSVGLLNARARIQNYTYSANGYISGEANVGWSVSLFPIPVNNLPASLIT